MLRRLNKYDLALELNIELAIAELIYETYRSLAMDIYKSNENPTRFYLHDSSLVAINKLDDSFTYKEKDNFIMYSMKNYSIDAFIFEEKARKIANAFGFNYKKYDRSELYG